VTGRINAVLVLATCYSQCESPQTSSAWSGQTWGLPWDATESSHFVRTNP